MVTIDCPWCEEEALLAMREAEKAATAFTSADCGTMVDFVEEPAVPLDLAA